MRPITYDEALALYRESGAVFSFIAAPYGVQKTITVNRGQILASPPQSAFALYEYKAQRRQRCYAGAR